MPHVTLHTASSHLEMFEDESVILVVTLMADPVPELTEPLVLYGVKVTTTYGVVDLVPGANTCADKRLSQDSLPLYAHMFLRGFLSCFQRLLQQLRYRGGFNQHGNEVVTLTLAPTLVSPQHLPATLVMSILLWPVNNAPTLTLHRSFTPSLGSPIPLLRTKDSDVMV